MATLAERVAARYKGKKVTDEGNVVYEYSKAQIDHRNREKAKRLEGLRSSIGKLRSQVQKDLKSSDPKTAMTALVIGLMDETYERVGNDESAAEGHFGVTGWKKSHISFSGGKATISYVGKSGVKQKKTVSDKTLVQALKRAYDDCKEGDCITGDVGAKDVNAYLKSFGISAKDIRGFHANDVMKAQLQAQRKGALPEDKKEREAKLKEEFKKALEETAAAVGHEPSTLKSQYLVPGLADSYLKDGTIPTKMIKEALLSDSPKSKRSKCMKCSKAPTKAVQWADGRGIAWYCDEHYKNHGLDDVVKEHTIEDGVMPTNLRKFGTMAERVAYRFLYGSYAIQGLTREEFEALKRQMRAAFKFRFTLKYWTSPKRAIGQVTIRAPKSEDWEFTEDQVVDILNFLIRNGYESSQVTLREQLSNPILWTRGGISFYKKV